jgi:hypothetical protein
MSELTGERRLEILESLGSTVCGGCGKSKPPGLSHCRRCYRRLPVAMMCNLYKRFGAGYEEAYEESLQYLQGAHA